MANLASIKERVTAQRTERFENKILRKNELFDMQDAGLLAAVKNPARYQAHLDFQARNPEISAGNAILILEQKPTASYVRKYDDWIKDNHKPRGKGNGIRVIKGYQYNKTSKIADTIDYSTGEMTEATMTEKRTGYDQDHVFDIRDTAPLPGGSKFAPISIKNDSPEMDAALGALLKLSPVDIEEMPEEGRAEMPQAFYDPASQKIFVQNEMPDNQFFQAVATEIVHAKLDDGSEYKRKDVEMAAECIGYMTAKRFGVEDLQLPDLSGLSKFYKGWEPKEIRGHLEAMRQELWESSKAIRRDLPRDDRGTDTKAPRLTRNQSAR